MEMNDILILSDDKTTVLSVKDKVVKSVVIPDCVTKIGENAFSGCESLESIDIPDSVTEIGKQAFKGCRSLKIIDIPNSVTKIGECVCCECAVLECINVVGNNSVYKSVEGVLYDKKMTSIIRFPMKHKNVAFVIPNSVTKIGLWAFDGCSSLESIVIPDSVTEIGGGAFSECESLESKDIV
jgi:hypothetical protein